MHSSSERFTDSQGAPLRSDGGLPWSRTSVGVTRSAQRRPRFSCARRRWLSSRRVTSAPHSGVRVMAGSSSNSKSLTIENYATRRAAEWGAEYARFLKASGAERLSATVLLPRRDAIVRQIALPGVAAKDIEGAVRFQLDTLHPYGEDEVVWGWSPLGSGAVLVGIVLRATMERYVGLFAEAGIAVRSFTFSAAVVHAGIRLNGAGHGGGGFVALSRSAAGAVEVYGESP